MSRDVVQVHFEWIEYEGIYTSLFAAPVSE
jgi:hypothetical protein